MPRTKDLHRFFWEQTAQALRLTNTSLIEKGRGTSSKITLSGRALRFDVEAGTYWEGSGELSSQYSFASVSLSGLPEGFAVDTLVGFTAGNRINLKCEDGRVRSVTLSSVPVQLEGLLLEQLSVDLNEFLTPRRRDAICSIEGTLIPLGDSHRLERRLNGDPYPKGRTLAAAVAGDPDAVQTLWRHRDRIVTLVEGALADARIADQLRV